MNEELKNILGRVDHTLLSQTATWAEIKAICDDGVKYGCASVCIPASYVKQAAEYVDGKIAICTVIGFPNGYDTTAAKCFEAADAVKNGASEIDMVINIGWVKDGLYDRVLEEIKAGNPNNLHAIEIMACPGGCIGGAGTNAGFAKTSKALKKYVDTSEPKLPSQELENLELN